MNTLLKLDPRDADLKTSELTETAINGEFRPDHVGGIGAAQVSDTRRDVLGSGESTRRHHFQEFRRRRVQLLVAQPESAVKKRPFRLMFMVSSKNASVVSASGAAL